MASCSMCSRNPSVSVRFLIFANYWKQRTPQPLSKPSVLDHGQFEGFTNEGGIEVSVDSTTHALEHQEVHLCQRIHQFSVQLSATQADTDSEQQNTVSEFNKCSLFLFRIRYGLIRGVIMRWSTEMYQSLIFRKGYEYTHRHIWQVTLLSVKK